MNKNYHFIAIGGSIMHNLAIALSQAGCKVSGSDDAIYEPALSALKSADILPEETGWHPTKIHSGLDAIILGMHAKKDNPELLKAIKLGLPVISFPEFMFEIAREKPRIVVAGSHGKTTVTSMLLHIFKKAGRSMNYLVGARLKGFDTMVNVDQDAELAIFEGDEYLASPLKPVPKFLFYQPDIAIITGIAWDHINVFPTFDLYLLQFEKFIQSIPNDGILVYNASDAELTALIKKIKPACITLPYKTPSFETKEDEIHFDWQETEIHLPMLGPHNASNFLAAAEAARAYGLNPEIIQKAASTFTGPSRRLEVVAKSKEFLMIDDFAHAPSKVRASVEAVKQHFPDRLITAVLELHTFSSLRPEFLKEYQKTMNAADRAYIYLNPEALAKKGKGVNEELVRKHFDHPNLLVSQKITEISERIRNNNPLPGVLLLMSSGNWGSYDWSDLATFVMQKKSNN